MRNTGFLCGQDRISNYQGQEFLYPEQPFAFPFELHGTGYHYITSHDYSYEGDKRIREGNSVILQYTVSGQGALEFGDRTYPVPAGHLMILPIPEKHRYFLPENSPFWEIRFVTFGGDGARDLVRAIRNRFGIVPSVRPDGIFIQRMIQLLEEPPPPTVWEAASTGMSLLAELGRELEETNEQCPRPWFITRALEYCRAHLDETFSVAELADACDLSRWYLSREFRKNLNMTIPQYMLRLRLEQGESLLRNSGLNIKEIASRCGFDDSAYFIRCFRNSRGITPSEYRAKL